jgi:hypothetical protein
MDYHDIDAIGAIGVIDMVAHVIVLCTESHMTTHVYSGESQ